MAVDEERNEDLEVGGPQKRLGRKPPANRATVKLGDFLRVQEIPDHPPVSPAPVVQWTMDRNDEAGVCVVSGLNHTLQAVAANLGQARTPWTDAEILDLYRTQNPGFTGWEMSGSEHDQGMVLQTFLEEAVRRGHITAFARIDDDNHALMRAATYIGGGIMTGELLRARHAQQEVWDAVGGNSPIWGGHCTTTVGYREGEQDCVTWGAIQPYTDAFAERHIEEAWFVLTPALLNNPGFRNNFDVAGFADAIADLTNGKVIVPVPVMPPTPPPVAPPGPNPAPTPSDPAWDDFPFAALDAWASTTPKQDTKRERKAKLAYRQWKANNNVDARNASTRRSVYDSEGNLIGEIEQGSGQFWASQS